MNQEKIYSLLGFAARSKKLTFGKERIRGYLRSDRRKKLVVIAKDASKRLKMDLRIRSAEDTVLLEMFTKSELGKLLGKSQISAVAVEDDSIVNGIIKSMEE